MPVALSLGPRAAIRAAAAPFPTFVNIAGKQRVGHFRAKTKFIAGVAGQGRAIGACETIKDRIVASVSIGLRIRVCNGKGCVIGTDHLEFVALRVFDVSVCRESRACGSRPLQVCRLIVKPAHRSLLPFFLRARVLQASQDSRTWQMLPPLQSPSCSKAFRRSNSAAASEGS